MGEMHVDKYVSEFVGTFLLVLTVCCNVLGGNAVWAATSIACVLMVSIYALGGVSGAHFNPAVTLAVALSDKMEGGWPRAAVYMIIQLIAGTVGALVGFTMYGSTFNVEPMGYFGGKQAAVVEILYTFMLCFVVLNCACSKSSAGNQYYGLAIGFVIIAGGYSAGAVSGGALNPAVAIGIDLAGVVTHGFGWSMAYTLFHLVGAALAAGLFRVVRAEDYNGEKNTMLAKLVSEFLGTYFLVLTVGLNVLADHAPAAFSIAASLMVMIYALGNVSGAHFNPAVTLAILLSGRNKISPLDAAQYIVVQLVAGLAAGMTYYGVHSKVFALAPGPGHSWGAVGCAEIIFTSVLCFVVLHVATTKEPSKDMFGLAIGSCITVGGYAIGGVSGGSLNPAVSFGIDTTNAIFAHAMWRNCIFWGAFELMGAAIASAAFYVTRQSEYGKDYQSMA